MHLIQNHLRNDPMSFRTYNMLRLVSLLLALGLSGCQKKNPEAHAPTWPNAVVGTLDRKEVEIVASKIGSLSFPVPREVLLAILPAGVTPDNVAIYELALHGKDEAGRNGGRIEDYWLNKDHVVRIGIAYYEKEAIKVEWAVVLSANDRMSYTKSPYPALDKEANQFPESTR